MSPTGRHEPRTRIALVLPSLAGGGTERVVLSLVRSFLAEGYAVDIVLRQARGELLGLVPPEARLVDLGCTRNLAVPFAFAGYLRRERPDLVLANMWPLSSLCVLGHRLARARSRIAVAEHGMLSRVPRYEGRLRRALLRATLAAACRMADGCIAVSSGVADDLAGLAGIPRAGVRVIFNPIPIPADADRREGGDPWEGSGGKRVLAVGRLVPEKNHLALIEAFARVVGTIEARLVILGEGPLRETLARRVDELGLGRAVKLPGFRDDPFPAYASADLLVLSSDYEAFGNVIVEALGCGVPVVSTDCPSGPREILRDGEFGALVPCGDVPALADAIVRALAAEADADRLKARARDFEPGRIAAAYLEVLLGTGPDGRARGARGAPPGAG